jgi:hypothetical protein
VGRASQPVGRWPVRLTGWEARPTNKASHKKGIPQQKQASHKGQGRAAFALRQKRRAASLAVQCSNRNASYFPQSEPWTQLDGKSMFIEHKGVQAAGGARRALSAILAGFGVLMFP